MNTSTHPFPSTLCDRSMVHQDTEQGISDGDKTPLPEHCGYTLINDCLVPETFIQRVIEQLEKGLYEYGCILSKEHLFESEFLASLERAELAVLMPVVLQLVARNKLLLNLWAACPENYEARAD